MNFEIDLRVMHPVEAKLLQPRSYFPYVTENKYMSYHSDPTRLDLFDFIDRQVVQLLVLFEIGTCVR